jgi:dipeptidase
MYISTNLHIMKILRTFIFTFLMVAGIDAMSCTSYIATRGATADGSTLISYAGDSHIRYGQLYFRPRGVWPEGSTLTIYDRSSNKPLGEIPQPAETYQVIGFINEYQVAIGESTFGGRSELADTTGKIDWGSIMFLGLQRAKTAREAVKVMVELLNEHGYYSSGQSYSIGDPNEAWILEIIGKGMDMKTDRKTKQFYNANRGVVWVARRIPDGHISAHANHARITEFPPADGIKSITSKELDKIFDPQVETAYAFDVIDFARKKGYFEGADEEFSFSDAYAPLDFGAQRFCDLRVWAMFDQVHTGMDEYWDYATGKTQSPRLPLSIKPDKKVSHNDFKKFKRNTLEGTELDMRKDIGAGSQQKPYRWRPLTWKYEDKTYFNERVTATQQTAFSWVAQLRNWVPDPIGGIFWYGVDDAGLTVHVPFYCGINYVPHSFAQGNGDILTYADDAAFWIFNRVSHTAYLFYNNAIDDIRKMQEKYIEQYDAMVTAIDAGALKLYEQNPKMAMDFITMFSVTAANDLVNEWREFGNFLLVKYLDGNIKQENDGEFLRNPWGFPKSPKHPDYPDEWKQNLIEKTGDRFIYPVKN